MNDLERCQKEIQRHITTIKGNNKVLKVYQDEIQHQIKTIDTMNEQLNQQTEMLLIEANKRREIEEKNTQLKKEFDAKTVEFCTERTKEHRQKVKEIIQKYEKKLEECQKKLEECQPTEEEEKEEEHWSQQLSKEKEAYKLQYDNHEVEMDEAKSAYRIMKKRYEEKLDASSYEDNLSLRNLVKAIRGKIMGAIRSGKNQVVRMVLEDDDEEWNGLMAEASQFGGRKRRRKTKRKRMRKRRRKTRKR